MTLEERIRKIFGQVLGIQDYEIDNSLSYNSFENWDSLTHLQLVSKIEDEFDIKIEMNDIVRMENFREIVKVVQKYI